MDMSPRQAVFEELLFERAAKVALLRVAAPDIERLSAAVEPLAALLGVRAPELSEDAGLRITEYVISVRRADGSEQRLHYSVDTDTVDDTLSADQHAASAAGTEALLIRAQQVGGSSDAGESTGRAASATPDPADERALVERIAHEARRRKGPFTVASLARDLSVEYGIDMTDDRARTVWQERVRTAIQ